MKKKDFCRLTAFCLAALFILAASACGGAEKKEDSDKSSQTSGTSEAAETAQPAHERTEAESSESVTGEEHTAETSEAAALPTRKPAETKITAIELEIQQGIAFQDQNGRNALLLKAFLDLANGEDIREDPAYGEAVKAKWHLLDFRQHKIYIDGKIYEDEDLLALCFYQKNGETRARQGIIELSGSGDQLAVSHLIVTEEYEFVSDEAEITGMIGEYFRRNRAAYPLTEDRINAAKKAAVWRQITYSDALPVSDGDRVYLEAHIQTTHDGAMDEKYLPALLFSEGLYLGKLYGCVFEGPLALIRTEADEDLIENRKALYESIPLSDHTGKGKYCIAFLSGGQAEAVQVVFYNGTLKP